MVVFAFYYGAGSGILLYRSMHLYSWCTAAVVVSKYGTVPGIELTRYEYSYRTSAPDVISALHGFIALLMRGRSSVDLLAPDDRPDEASGQLRNILDMCPLASARQ